MSDLFRPTPSSPSLAPSPVVVATPEVASTPPPPTRTKFPLCEQLFGVHNAQGEYLTCLSVFRELGNTAALGHLQHRLKMKKGLTAEIHQLVPNVSWWNQQWNDHHDSDQPEPCVAVEDLSKFVPWAQGRSRKPLAAKERLLTKFHIVPATVETKVPVEIKVLDFLSQCLPLKMEFQYRVGKYRLDAFIPRLHLAIQVDEHGHAGYPPDEEKEYDQVMRDHNIVVLRFNPDAKYLTSPELELVKQVWTRTLSPDFAAFREKYKL